MEFQLSEVSRCDFECGEVEWSVKCRNCQDVYPKDLKDRVKRRILEDNMTILKAITISCLEYGIKKYCCINNFKAVVKKEGVPQVVKDMFVELRSGVYIDKTMIDWMDITWDDDEDRTCHKINEITTINHDNGVSLFDL